MSCRMIVDVCVSTRLLEDTGLGLAGWLGVMV